jgi:hypothetical protein
MVAEPNDFTVKRHSLQDKNVTLTELSGINLHNLQ